MDRFRHGLGKHDILCSVLPEFYGSVYLSQQDRPEGMNYFNFVISEVHGLRKGMGNTWRICTIACNGLSTNERTKDYAMWMDEIKLLIEKVEELTGNKITIEGLKKAIDVCIGSGKKREDIAYGVIDSITGRVKSLCQKHSDAKNYFLTGGLCENEYIIERLSEKLGRKIKSHHNARFAGSIGAAVIAQELKL